MLALTGCKTATENNLSYFRNLGDSPSGVMPQGMGYDIKIVPQDELRYPRLLLCSTSHRPIPPLVVK